MSVRAELRRKLRVPLPIAFSAIATTDSYPRIFREVSHSRATWLDDTTANVDLVISVGPFKELFRSRLKLNPQSSIHARMTSGTLKSLAMVWTFDTISKERTLVSANLEFDARTRAAEFVLQRIVDAKLQGVADRFAQEALALHAAQSETTDVDNST